MKTEVNNKTAQKQNNYEDWSLEELFAEVDRILSKPIYKEEEENKSLPKEYFEDI